MIYLCVTMKIRKGMMEPFLAECRRVRPLVLAEEGCLEYDLTCEIEMDLPRREPVDPDRVTLYEKWANPEALARHGATAHMAEYSARVKDFRESVTIRTGTEAF